MTCGVYTTNSVEACEHVFRDCKSEIVVVENKQQLEKILKCKEKNIPIKKIINLLQIINNMSNIIIML